MCIIAICSSRFLTDNELENCFMSNHDGVGMAWAENGKVSVRKGFMTLEEANLAYAKFQLEHPEFIPHVLHFRIATSGGASPEMTHPYKMTTGSELSLSEDTDKSVLFHNGVIPNWNTSLVNLVTSKQIPKMPKGPMNDTRMAAIMASLPDIGDEILEVLSGKFVKVQPDGTIIRWGKFEFDNGVYFSNTSYKWKVYRYQNGCNIHGCDGVVSETIIQPDDYLASLEQGYSSCNSEICNLDNPSNGTTQEEVDLKLLGKICSDICGKICHIWFSRNVHGDIKTHTYKNSVTIELSKKIYPTDALVISAIARELVHVTNMSIEEDYASFTNDLAEMEGWLLYDYYNNK